MIIENNYGEQLKKFHGKVIHAQIGGGKVQLAILPKLRRHYI